MSIKTEDLPLDQAIHWFSDLEKKGERDLLKEEQIDHIFREYPYIYAQVGDLTLNDVEALLNSYKQVVLKYVSLSKGLGQTVALDTTIKPAATERRSTDSATDGANNEDVAIGKNDEEVSGMASEEAENLEYMLSQSLESDLGVHSSAEKKSWCDDDADAFFFTWVHVNSLSLTQVRDFLNFVFYLI